MEVSEVRRHVLATIDKAKKTAAERRVRHDQTARDYETFLERIAVPIFRQVANVLKAERYTFTVFTPSASVRLMSDTRSEDYIEISLDTSAHDPMVVGTTHIGRGRRVLESQEPIATGSVQSLTEADVLEFLLKALEPFVER